MYAWTTHMHTYLYICTAGTHAQMCVYPIFAQHVHTLIWCTSTGMYPYAVTYVVACPLPPPHTTCCPLCTGPTQYFRSPFTEVVDTVLTSPWRSPVF